jgi:hypothetical protein
MMTMNATIKGLREMADFLEAHPSLYEIPGLAGGLTLNLFVDSKEQLADAARAIGKLSKRVSGDYYYVQREFSGNVTLDVNASRQKVCEKVVVGTKVIPAQPERVLPAEPEQVVEEYEWVCPKSLLSESIE